jgi:hypothetical protein
VGVLTVHLSPSRITVIDEAGLADFVRVVLTNATAALRLTGVASPAIGMVIGTVSITNITVDEVVVMPGMNSLQVRLVLPFR